VTTGADAPDDPGSDGSPSSASPSDETGRPSTRWVAVMSVLGVVSAAWLLSRVWHDTWGRTQLDFAVYVLGAHHLMDGRLYHVGLPYPPYLPFTYPPVAPLAFWPLAVLPRQVAQLVWAAVNVASLYGVIALSLRAMLPGMDRTRLLLWSVVLLGPSYLLDPVRLTFYFGQVNLVLCLLLLADLTTTLEFRGRTLPRGVLVGVAAAVKLVPLVFVPYLFVTRQARAAWTALATFVACSLLATAFDPATSWAYWTKYATDAARVGNPSYILNQSLQGTLDRLTHRDVSVVVVDAAGALVLVGGIALARWAWRDSSSFLGILVCATTGMVVLPDHVGAPPGLGRADPVVAGPGPRPARRRAAVGRSRRPRALAGAAPTRPVGRDAGVARARMDAPGRKLVLRAADGLPGRSGRLAGRPPGMWRTWHSWCRGPGQGAGFPQREDCNDDVDSALGDAVYAATSHRCPRGGAPK
jgi:hypothetical protein